MRCTMRGVKPAIDASVRRASSSAVLREFTIQSLSAYDEKGAGLAGEATPSPHGTDHSSSADMSLRRVIGARL